MQANNFKDQYWYGMSIINYYVILPINDICMMQLNDNNNNNRERRYYNESVSIPS